MRFSELDHHAIWLVHTDRERIRRFIDGLTYQLRFLITRERLSGATFDEVVDIARQIEMVLSQERGQREAKRSRRPGDLSGVPSGGQFYRDRGRPYRHTQTGRPVHRGALFSHGSYSYHQVQSSLNSLPAQRSSHAPSVPGSSAPGSSSGYSSAQGFLQSPLPFTGRGCFECGYMGHIKRPDDVASDTVITGIVSVYHKEVSVLFNPGSTHSYVSSYFAHHLDMPRESLVLSVHVSMLVGDTIIVDRVYRSCVVTTGSLDTRVDLLLLSMVDFDVILGMDWLSPCHAVLDCHAKIVTLAMPGLLRTEWRGFLDYVLSRVISYLKSRRMVGKGCLYYLAFVRDVSADAPTIDFVPVVREFPDVFPADLSGMPPDRDIDFGIDLVLKRYDGKDVIDDQDGRKEHAKE
ncbi:uncharacterized protein [Nicotiana tomentosiformis]|uniref:uncharacterized protein n=1 Tax=Nicotiana tomentosiformis TaxID=4098 RepID=UPI00388C7D44